MIMRPVSLCKRPELILAAQGRQDDGHWIVEDPIAMKYFRLRDEEWFILQSLNGEIGFEEIRRRFENEFTPVRLGKEQLNRFLFHLHELGLVIANAPEQGKVLSERNSAQQRRHWLSVISNPLAITLPGIPARPWLDRLYRQVGWLLHPVSLALGVGFIASAMLLVVFQFGLFQERLPTFNEFFSPKAALWFVFALILTKTLHELGHALASRHYGGSCREIGLMLLVFVPTLYCDVSDSWRVRSRWHRAAIAAAGMYVEGLIAAMATFAWWFSEPGNFNAVCLRVMFLCSVSTILFNANPLVRCDGYYILSDLLRIPNLWQESRSICLQWIQRWFSGQNLHLRHHHRRSMVYPLIIYAVASTFYCTLLIAGILWLAMQILEPEGFGIVAWVLCLMVAFGFLIKPVQQLLRYIFTPNPHRFTQQRRWLITSALALTGLFCLFTIPIPDRITAPVALDFESPTPIYAEVSGAIDRTMHEGALIKEGDSLVELRNSDLDMTIHDLRADVERRRSHVSNIKKMLPDDPSLAPLLPAEEKALEDAQHRLTIWEHDRARLKLSSSRSGVLVAPEGRKASSTSQTQLASWNGIPLDDRNQGAVLEVGDVIGYVADPTKYEATIWVDQSDMVYVRVGQQVKIRLEQSPWVILTGTISSLALDEADELSWDLVRKFDLPMRTHQSEQPQLASVYYQAKVKLDASTIQMLPGMHGQAKIFVDPRPLGQRWLQTILRTFRF